MAKKKKVKSARGRKSKAPERQAPSLSSTLPLSVKTSSPGSVPDQQDKLRPKGPTRVEEQGSEERDKERDIQRLTTMRVRKTRSDAGELPHIAGGSRIIPEGDDKTHRPGMPSVQDLGILAGITEKLNPHATAMIMRSLCQNAYYSYGNYQDWEKSSDGKYLPDRVMEIAVNTDFQIRVWPQIKVILKANCYNTDWSMQVMVRLALHEVVCQIAQELYPPEVILSTLSSEDVDPDGDDGDFLDEDTDTSSGIV